MYTRVHYALNPYISLTCEEQRESLGSDHLRSVVCRKQLRSRRKLLTVSCQQNFTSPRDTRVVLTIDRHLPLGVPAMTINDIRYLPDEMTLDDLLRDNWEVLQEQEDYLLAGWVVR